jgi:hypothetical protein
MVETAKPAAFIKALRVGDLARPTKITHLRALQVNESFLTRATADPDPGDGTPILPEAPTAIDRTYTATDGQVYFVPEAVVAKKSKTSATPAVFIDRKADAWSLHVTVELVRHEAVPATAIPLPVGGLHIQLTSALLDAPLVLTDHADEAPGDPTTTFRRVIASASISDQGRIASILREDENARITVGGTVHYQTPPPPAPPPSSGEPDRPIVMTSILMPELLTIKKPRINKFALMAAAMNFKPNGLVNFASPLGTKRLSALATDRVMLSKAALRIIADSQPAAPPSPTAQSLAVNLTRNPAGISAWFPTETPANRPIFALVDSAFGVDPNATWIISGDLPWKASPMPNEYYVLPAAYRIRYDTERQLPAMTVLLMQQPDAATGAVAYRVRVQFEVVPVFDEGKLADLRNLIAQEDGIVYPTFAVGGYERATFKTSALLGDLGGKVITGADGTTEIDPRSAFELVFDCTLEFYTLLAKMLAPGVGSPPGIEGSVRFELKSGEDQVKSVDVPVDLRLDRPWGDVLDSELVPPSPVWTWPDGWHPPSYVKITSTADRAVQVGRTVANLLRVDPKLGVVQDTVKADVWPAAFAIGDATAPASAPTAPVVPVAPTFPGPVEPDPFSTLDGAVRAEVQAVQDRLADLGHPVAVTGVLAAEMGDVVKAFQRQAGIAETGVVDAATWGALYPSAAPPPPAVGEGEVLLTLMPTEPIDPRLITATDVAFVDVSMVVDAAASLERVHELAASGSLSTKLRVTSFQLQHPDNLPADLADLGGLEIQIRHGSQPASTVYLTRDEASKTVPLGYSLADVLAGASPDTPRFEWRRRNMTSKGNGPFSTWEQVTGAELFATPVTADVALDPA